MSNLQHAIGWRQTGLLRFLSSVQALHNRADGVVSGRASADQAREHAAHGFQVSQTRHGDAAEAARLMKLFDRYRPEKAVVIPSAFLEHAY